jgi:hypothetical protein
MAVVLPVVPMAVTMLGPVPSATFVPWKTWSALVTAPNGAPFTWSRTESMFEETFTVTVGVVRGLKRRDLLVLLRVRWAGWIWARRVVRVLGGRGTDAILAHRDHPGRLRRVDAVGPRAELIGAAVVPAEVLVVGDDVGADKKHKRRSRLIGWPSVDWPALDFRAPSTPAGDDEVDLPTGIRHEAVERDVSERDDIAHVKSVPSPWRQTGGQGLDNRREKRS